MFVSSLAAQFIINYVNIGGMGWERDTGSGKNWPNDYHLYICIITIIFISVCFSFICFTLISLNISFICITLTHKTYDICILNPTLYREGHFPNYYHLCICIITYSYLSLVHSFICFIILLFKSC